MAMVPLPQFQAQRPEAVGANVINAAPRYNSFWGQVAPSILQLAGGIRTMIEGDPGVNMQERQLNSLESERTTNQLRAGENQAANEAYLDAQIAKTDDPQRKAELLALKAHAGDFVTYKNRAAGKQFEHLSSVDDAVNQQRALKQQQGNAGQQPGATNTGFAQGPGEPGSSSTAPSTAVDPGGTNPTAELMGGFSTSPQSFPSQTGEVISDHGAVPPPGQQEAIKPTGPGQPLPPDVQGAGTGPQAALTPQQHLMEVAAKAQTTVDKLHMNSNGQIIPHPELILDGKASPADALPLPPPGSIDPTEARYSESVGAQLAALKMKAVQDNYLAMAWGKIAAGKDLDDTALAALDMNDVKTQQAITSAQHTLGISSPDFNMANIQKMALLMNMTQDQLRLISVDPDARGQFEHEFGKLFEAYNNSPNNVKIAMTTAAQTFAKDQAGMQKIMSEYRADMAKAEAATLKAKIEEQRAVHKEYIDNRKADQFDTKLGIEARRADTAEQRAETLERYLTDKTRQNDRKLDQGDRGLDIRGNLADNKIKLTEAQIKHLGHLDSHLAKQDEATQKRVAIASDRMAWAKDPKNPIFARSASGAATQEQKAHRLWLDENMRTNGFMTRGLKPRRPDDRPYPDMFAADYYSGQWDGKGTPPKPQALSSFTQTYLRKMHDTRDPKILEPLTKYDWITTGKEKGMPPEEAVILQKAAEMYHGYAQRGK